MADFKWDLLERGGAFNDGRHRNKIRIAVSGRMQISKQAYETLGEPLFVKVFHDASNKAIGVEPSDTEEKNCYKVSTHRGTAFSAATIGLQLVMKPGNYSYAEDLGASKYIFVREEE